MAKLGRTYRKYVKKSGLKKYGRAMYKATGLVNPVKKGKLSTARLYKDVQMLKGIINSEKFRVEAQPISDVAIGQVNANTSGHKIYDFTPVPSQGDGYNNRQGNSIRWKSSHISMLIQRMSGNVGAFTMQIELIKVIGVPYDSGSLNTAIEGRYIEPNRWVNGASIYDMASDRKPEYFKQFRTLIKKKVHFPAPNYSGQAPTMQKILNFGLRLPNHHVKWNNNTNNLSDGQVLCLITCDTGNASTTTACTLDSVANTVVSSGVYVNCNLVHYYYDN